FFIVPVFFSLIISLLSLKKSKHPFFIYRLNTVLFGNLLLFMLATGGPNGSKMQWMYMYPLIIYLLLGKNEGLYWNTAIILSCFGIYFNPAHWTALYSYPASTAIRFLLSYCCVSLVTHWFEYYRRSYKLRLLQRTEELQKALDEVKTLSGYLPVCASCKRVRDKDGNWIDLEDYIEAHSEAEISHGLCRDCIKEIYPEIDEELDTSHQSEQE
ncbi:MAG: hypothetical protein PQJ60_11980, partial [Spirochaetales bacterium]|nr:hypothetical protein [Spirochaetales bacterium]